MLPAASVQMVERRKPCGCWPNNAITLTGRHLAVPSE